MIVAIPELSAAHLAQDLQKVYALESSLAQVNKLSTAFIKQYATAIELVTKQAIRSGHNLDLNESAMQPAIDELAALMMYSYLAALQSNLPDSVDTFSARLSARATALLTSSAVDSKITSVMGQLEKRKQGANKLRDKSKALQKKYQTAANKAKSYTAPTARKREREKAKQLKKELDALRQRVSVAQAKTIEAKVNLGKLSKQMQQLAARPVRESLHSVKKRINESLSELAKTGKSKAEKEKIILKRLEEMGVVPKSPGIHSHDCRHAHTIDIWYWPTCGVWRR